MTPYQAEDRMRKIARRSKHHPRKARELGIELLSEIARKTGFYKVADMFERIPQESKREHAEHHD